MIVLWVFYSPRHRRGRSRRRRRARARHTWRTRDLTQGPVQLCIMLSVDLLRLPCIHESAWRPLAVAVSVISVSLRMQVYKLTCGPPLGLLPRRRPAHAAPAAQLRAAQARGAQPGGTDRAVGACARARLRARAGPSAPCVLHTTAT